MIQPG
jgi:archaellum component FlaC